MGEVICVQMGWSALIFRNFAWGARGLDPAVIERSFDPIAHRSNIRVEERPGVASAQSVPPFDQPHRDLRPLPREPVGNQTVREAAAR